MPNFGVYGTLEISELPLNDIEYDIEHVTIDGHSYLEITFKIGLGEFTARFTIERAEKFIVELRDEIVRAKQAQLEWETDTDPETGVIGERQ